MRIRVLGGGWYGCSLAVALLADGHKVELHEKADRLFAGASGANPARLHRGFHYPRSGATRAACRDHYSEFMSTYGRFTRAVPLNIYAVAEADSLVDFATYQKVLEGETPFLVAHDPAEFGLHNVEGALITGERHIVIDRVREHFEDELAGHVCYGMAALIADDPRWDLTVDATFCALDAENVDRYEPCITALLEGPADRAVTIMDGPFPSVFPWDASRGLSSLTSASLTPFSKACQTWLDARMVLDSLGVSAVEQRAELMLEQMAHFWPDVRDRYRIVDHRLAIRAMPKSRADTRLCDVLRVGERALRIRAGKIDAIFHAIRAVRAHIASGAIRISAAA